MPDRNERIRTSVSINSRLRETTTLGRPPLKMIKSGRCLLVGRPFTGTVPEVPASINQRGCLVKSFF